jgi:hypothetical protein
MLKPKRTVSLLHHPCMGKSRHEFGSQDLTFGESNILHIYPDFSLAFALFPLLQLCLRNLFVTSPHKRHRNVRPFWLINAWGKAVPLP